MVALRGSLAGVRGWASAGFLAVMVSGGWVPAGASGPDETILDAGALIQLEQRADRAEPREQCYLYTELLHALTETAGRQMAAGRDEDVTLTLQQIESVMTKARGASAKNAKRLKDAEVLMEHTRHRLADMTRVASSGERAAMEATLQHLDRVHSDVLAMVFAP